MRANHLDCALDRLGAGIGKKHPRESACFRDPARERALVFVIIEIRNVQEQARLLTDHPCQPRMGVAERVHADSGQQVEIALSDRKSTRLNSSHVSESRMPSSA